MEKLQVVQKCIFCKKEFDPTENKGRNICPDCARCVICGNEIDQLDKEGRSICINCGKKYYSDSLIVYGPFPVKNRKFQESTSLQEHPGCDLKAPSSTPLRSRLKE